MDGKMLGRAAMMCWGNTALAARAVPTSGSGQGATKEDRVGQSPRPEWANEKRILVTPDCVNDLSICFKQM